MKDILIFSHCMELGGAERSLIGLLSALDYTRVTADLFLMRHTGELMKHIDPRADLLPEDKNYSALAIPMSSLIKRGQLGMLVSRLRGKLHAEAYEKKHNPDRLPSDVALTLSHKYTLRHMPYIRPEKEYDLAISFLTPHYFVRERVRAKRYAAFIHTDYTVHSLDRGQELEMWGRYDDICAVSRSVAEGFIHVFPELAEKVTVIENILPGAMIRAQADEFDVSEEMKYGKVKLLSIGRFCDAKNFDNLPAICAELRKRGVDVCWYIIGFGGDEALIRQKISETGMGEYVRILGAKDNPYPYIKACDLYVQPSRYEGKSVCVREAQILCKPTVITEYPTSRDQLCDGIDGVIVPLDNAGCAAGIADLLTDKKKIEELRAHCVSCDFTGKSEVSKIYALAGG